VTDLLRVFQAMHGYLAALAIVGLIHPAILLRRGLPLSRGGRWALSLSTLVTVITFASGIAIYGSYRELVKPSLLASELAVAMLFETKEHLAFCVVSFAVGAWVAAVVAPRSAVDIRKTAALIFAAAAALGLVTLALGTYVAAVKDFGPM
jgi:hypothetical protein